MPLFITDPSIRDYLKKNGLDPDAPGMAEYMAQGGVGLGPQPSAGIGAGFGAAGTGALRGLANIVPNTVDLGFAVGRLAGITDTKVPEIPPSFTELAHPYMSGAGNAVGFISSFAVPPLLASKAGIVGKAARFASFDFLAPEAIMGAEEALLARQGIQAGGEGFSSAFGKALAVDVAARAAETRPGLFAGLVPKTVGQAQVKAIEALRGGAHLAAASFTAQPGDVDERMAHAMEGFKFGVPQTALGPAQGAGLAVRAIQGGLAGLASGPAPFEIEGVPEPVAAAGVGAFLSAVMGRANAKQAEKTPPTVTSSSGKETIVQPESKPIPASAGDTVDSLALSVLKGGRPNPQMLDLVEHIASLRTSAPADYAVIKEALGTMPKYGKAFEAEKPTVATEPQPIQESVIAEATEGVTAKGIEVLKTSLHEPMQSKSPLGAMGLADSTRVGLPYLETLDGQVSIRGALEGGETRALPVSQAVAGERELAGNRKRPPQEQIRQAVYKAAEAVEKIPSSILNILRRVTGQQDLAIHVTDGQTAYYPETNNIGVNYKLVLSSGEGTTIPIVHEIIHAGQVRSVELPEGRAALRKLYVALMGEDTIPFDSPPHVEGTDGLLVGKSEFKLPDPFKALVLGHFDAKGEGIALTTQVQDPTDPSRAFVLVSRDRGFIDQVVGERLYEREGVADYNSFATGRLGYLFQNPHEIPTVLAESYLYHPVEFMRQNPKLAPAVQEYLSFLSGGEINPFNLDVKLPATNNRQLPLVFDTFETMKPLGFAKGNQRLGTLVPSLKDYASRIGEERTNALLQGDSPTTPDEAGFSLAFAERKDPKELGSVVVDGDNYNLKSEIPGFGHLAENSAGERYFIRPDRTSKLGKFLADPVDADTVRAYQVERAYDQIKRYIKLRLPNGDSALRETIYDSIVNNLEGRDRIPTDATWNNYLSRLDENPWDAPFNPTMLGRLVNRVILLEQYGLDVRKSAYIDAADTLQAALAKIGPGADPQAVAALARQGIQVGVYLRDSPNGQHKAGDPRILKVPAVVPDKKLLEIATALAQGPQAVRGYEVSDATPDTIDVEHTAKRASTLEGARVSEVSASVEGEAQASRAGTSEAALKQAASMIDPKLLKGVNADSLTQALMTRGFGETEARNAARTLLDPRKLPKDIKPNTLPAATNEIVRVEAEAIKESKVVQPAPPEIDFGPLFSKEREQVVAPAPTVEPVVARAVAASTPEPLRAVKQLRQRTAKAIKAINEGETKAVKAGAPPRPAQAEAARQEARRQSRIETTRIAEAAALKAQAKARKDLTGRKQVLLADLRSRFRELASKASRAESRLKSYIEQSSKLTREVEKLQAQADGANPKERVRFGKRITVLGERLTELTSEAQGHLDTLSKIRPGVGILEKSARERGGRLSEAALKAKVPLDLSTIRDIPTKVLLKNLSKLEDLVSAAEDATREQVSAPEIKRAIDLQTVREAIELVGTATLDKAHDHYAALPPSLQVYHTALRISAMPDSSAWRARQNVIGQFLKADPSREVAYPVLAASHKARTPAKNRMAIEQEIARLDNPMPSSASLRPEPYGPGASLQRWIVKDIHLGESSFDTLESAAFGIDLMRREKAAAPDLTPPGVDMTIELKGHGPSGPLPSGTPPMDGERSIASRPVSRTGHINKIGWFSRLFRLPNTVLAQIDRDVEAVTGKDPGLAPYFRTIVSKENYSAQQARARLSTLAKAVQQHGIRNTRAVERRLAKAARYVDDGATTIMMQMKQAGEKDPVARADAAREALPELQATAASQFELTPQETRFMFGDPEHPERLSARRYFEEFYRDLGIAQEEVIGYYPRRIALVQSLEKLGQFSDATEWGARPWARELARSRGEAEGELIQNPQYRALYDELQLDGRLDENFFDTVSQYTFQGYRVKALAAPVQEFKGLVDRLGGENNIGLNGVKFIEAAVRSVIHWASPTDIVLKDSTRERRAKIAKKLWSLHEQIEESNPMLKPLASALKSVSQSLGIKAIEGREHRLAQIFTRAHRQSIFGLSPMRALRDSVTTDMFFLYPRFGARLFAKGFGDQLNPNLVREKYPIYKELGLLSADDFVRFQDADSFSRYSKHADEILSAMYRVNDLHTRFLATRLSEIATPEGVTAFNKAGGGDIGWSRFKQVTGLDTYKSLMTTEKQTHLRALVESGNITELWPEVARIHLDGAVFNYLRANAPQVFQSSIGRFFGQYGVWPANAVHSLWEMYTAPVGHHGAGKGMLRGVQLAARYALAAGVAYNLGYLFGVDTSSWIPFVHNTLSYDGGPGMTLFSYAHDLFTDEAVLNRWINNPVKEGGRLARNLVPIPAGDTIRRTLAQFVVDPEDAQTRAALNLSQQQQEASDRWKVALGFTPFSESKPGYYSLVGNALPFADIQDYLSQASGDILPAGTADEERNRKLRRGLP